MPALTRLRAAARLDGPTGGADPGPHRRASGRRALPSHGRQTLQVGVLARVGYMRRVLPGHIPVHRFGEVSESN